MNLKVSVQRKIDAVLNSKDDAGNMIVHDIDDCISETSFGIWVEVLPPFSTANKSETSRAYRSWAFSGLRVG